MSKCERDRLEITFGKKDADLYRYLQSFGLPMASLVKKMIRDNMEGKTPEVKSVNIPKIVAPVLKEDDEVTEEKKPSPFGSFAKKR